LRRPKLDSCCSFFVLAGVVEDDSVRRYNVENQIQKDKEGLTIHQEINNLDCCVVVVVGCSSSSSSKP
jgi:hypothetical protein